MMEFDAQYEADIRRFVIFGEGAAAKCSAKDALELRNAPVGDWEIWWLGTVPCRTVHLIGICVGVVEYEKRVLYTLDDGSQVIDCSYDLKIAPPSIPKDDIRNEKSKGKLLAIPPRSVYRPPPPIEVGTTISVIGKVVDWRDGNQIHVDTIDSCTLNKESKHRIEVSRLHQTKYSQPFTLPRYVPPVTPRRNRVLAELPQRTNFVAPSSPISSTCAGSSPAKPISPTSPLLLRHPLRISSSQLTTHTFRSHLTQYLKITSKLSTKRKYTPSQEDRYDWGTPTKKSRQEVLEQTPRPGRRAQEGALPKFTGVSLSSLRRVPELDCLGRRILRAEAKKKERDAKLKAREARKRRKENGQSVDEEQCNQAPKLSQTTSTERLSLQVKRLFQKTLRTLRQDGVIIIVDPADDQDLLEPEEDGRRTCWRDPATCTKNASYLRASASRATSVVSSIASSPIKPQMGTLAVEIDEDPPSDVDERFQEERYVFVSPEVLAEPLLAVMRKIIGRGKGMRGPTVDEALARLRREDDKWSQMHADQILQTMLFLEETDKVWDVGEGKWGLME